MADSKKTTDGDVKARPKHQGHDPLARGERLYNDSNKSSATHYRSDDSELKAEQTPKAAEKERAENLQESHDRSAEIVDNQNALDNDDNVNSRDDSTNDSPEVPKSQDSSDDSDKSDESDSPEPAKGANKQAAENNAENSDLSKTETKRAAKSAK